MLQNLYTPSANNTSVSFKITENVQKLHMRVAFKAPTDANLGVSQFRKSELMGFILFDRVLNGFITVSRINDEGGTKVMIPRVRIGHLAQICAIDGGIVNIRPIDPHDTAEDDYEALFSIDLSNLGAIACDNQKYIRVDLDGFSTYDLSSLATSHGIASASTMTALACTIQTFALSAPNIVNNAIEYRPVTCDAGGLVFFDTLGAYKIVSPFNFDKLTMYSSVADTSTDFVAMEMSLLAHDAEDSVYRYGISVPAYSHRGIDVTLYARGSVMYSAQSILYVLKNKDFSAWDK